MYLPPGFSFRIPVFIFPVNGTAGKPYAVKQFFGIVHRMAASWSRPLSMDSCLSNPDLN